MVGVEPKAGFAPKRPPDVLPPPKGDEVEAVVDPKPPNPPVDPAVAVPLPNNPPPPADVVAPKAGLAPPKAPPVVLPKPREKVC